MPFPGYKSMGKEQMIVVSGQEVLLCKHSDGKDRNSEGCLRLCT